ncbi:hypothetical protein [Desulfobacca acetoxidans]|uniref:Uncharacterized protein n=1 Tax=Desulfobacca acetoxidans (strain ATCC 700848 / DSM 11109 / ASRB2) TaxID=880072 RepID=F2NJ00_DESAR|nr:hypothetical protein [Desulfobacca acetoxidans]AEB10765.1 hypothetical protein Desac_2969 [Desulfobacca acetoxidans DSM 11109]HAY21948.1 hypothetical protein [Desulfobacterales bacterium]
MHLREIISTLMLSDFYFSLPLVERKQVVLRLWSQYGGEFGPPVRWSGQNESLPSFGHLSPPEKAGYEPLPPAGF